jgi:hypothetical protein
LSSFIVLPICGLLKRKLFQDDMIDGRNEEFLNLYITDNCTVWPGEIQ